MYIFECINRIIPESEQVEHASNTTFSSFTLVLAYFNPSTMQNSSPNPPCWLPNSEIHLWTYRIVIDVFTSINIYFTACKVAWRTEITVQHFNIPGVNRPKYL